MKACVSAAHLHTVLYACTLFRWWASDFPCVSSPPYPQAKSRKHNWFLRRTRALYIFPGPIFSLHLNSHIKCVQAAMLIWQDHNKNNKNLWGLLLAWPPLPSVTKWHSIGWQLLTGWWSVATAFRILRASLIWNARCVFLWLSRSFMTVTAVAGDLRWRAPERNLH